ncbi:DUF7948 domain-containing protein [Candidatus Nitrospira nitrificans]
MSAAPALSANPRLTATVLNAPIRFEANHGQTDPSVNFIARGGGYTLFLTPNESVMVLSTREASSVKGEAESDPTHFIGQESQKYKHSVVRMKLEGANPEPVVNGMEQLPGIVNYFIGNDPVKWRTKIPTYAKVNYREVYPGIDVAYYGNQGKLEYDFIVSPGADPNQIKLAFEGVSEIKVAESGDILLATALGDVRVQKPIVYQFEKDGHKTLVAGNYVLQPSLSTSSQGADTGKGTLPASHEVGIQLAVYDHDKTLVIDPVLTYSSYLGGALGEESRNRAIAADPSGNAYITGSTASTDFPIAGTPFQTVSAGFNAFITKVNPTGSALVYSTYLGGLGNTIAFDLDVDAAGNVYLAGSTASPNFPVTPGSMQTVRGSTTDAFVTKINSSGSGLLYSTFLGGNGDEVGTSIAIDSSGKAFVGGWTVSTNFPSAGVSPFQSTLAGGRDAFWAVLNPAGNGLIQSTYYGGILNDEANGIAVDSVGNVYITGTTSSANLFGVNAASLQPSIGGGQDAFVASFNTGTNTLVYSTYLGGSGNDGGTDIVVNGSGDCYVTGSTRSSNFPIAGSPAQPVLGGNADTFVFKLNSAGSSLVYSTFLGGAGDDFGSGIAVDSAGNAYVSGGTRSLTWPGTSGSPIQPSNAGSADAFVTKLSATGTAVIFSTFLGGSLDDNARGIALDGNGNVLVAGDTKSSNFHTQSPYQAAFGGSADAWVAKISDKPLAHAGSDQSVPESTLVTLDGAGSTGGSLTYIWTQVAGPSVALGGASTAHPTFAAPNVPAAGGTVTLELVVCEGTSSNCSDPDTVNVHITDVNHPPVAQAGPDQTVQEGSPVILDGTASYDPDIETLTYTWLQVFGPSVTLASSHTATPSFTAPSVGTSGAQVDFELIVTDPRGLNHSDFDSVRISNVNQPPTANAGPDQTKNEQTLVTLDGSGSLDPDLDGLSYSWTQTGGPSVLLTGANTTSPTFTAPNVAAGGAFLTFQLTVHDGHVSSAVDTVQVAVVNVNDPPVCTLAQASPNLLWPPNHTMTQVSIVGLTDPQNQTLTITYPTVKQDEPINGLGDGDTSPDAAVSGNDILLRAERAGSGNGRVYVVQFTATNADGAHCSGTVKVTVPHNKKDQAIQGPQLHNSFGQ